MIKTTLSFLLLILSLQIFAQTKSKISLEVSYGLQGNFFVRSYNENGRPDGTAFLNKSFIGSISGIELKFQATKMASWNFGYAQSSNAKRIGYSTIINGLGLSINDFDIKHENRFYQLFYQRNFSKKTPNFKYEFGIFYLRSQQQEIIIGNIIDISQRNFANSKLEEGGLSAGLQYSKKIDTKFDIGIRSRIYYLVSTNTLETITLTPTLTYHF
ncbi:MAG TPA: hypothetical protein PL108_00710 [Sediminibacterium sp.]|jgi:hypothetical protein|nr:hypothetical protein [Chitinophaga sp.]HPH36146.1 hypothetical protein [Sediminibacterium sp.]